MEVVDELYPKSWGTIQGSYLLYGFDITSNAILESILVECAVMLHRCVHGIEHASFAPRVMSYHRMDSGLELGLLSLKFSGI